MSELTQSVVVCNLDGRVLLYNSRAAGSSRALSAAPGVSGGAELIGLGARSTRVRPQARRPRARERAAALLRGARPSAQFVTGTRGGQLLRVQMAPVRGSRRPGEGVASTRLRADAGQHHAGLRRTSPRDQLLHGLTEGQCASLGNPGGRRDARLRRHRRRDARALLAVIRDEVQAMSGASAIASHTAQTQKTRWPLEDMLGADRRRRLRRIEASTAAPVRPRRRRCAVAEGRQLLAAAGAGYLAGRPSTSTSSRQLRLAAAGPGGAPGPRLDRGQAMSTET